MIVAVLPAWWRFAQCLRRYYDTKEANPHLINAGKYSTSFFVAVFSAVASAVISEGREEGGRGGGEGEAERRERE